MLGAFYHGLISSSRPTAGSSTTWKVASGSYIGTGAALSIAGVGFQPQFLIIKATGSTANDDPVFAFSGMTTLAAVTPAATIVDPIAAPASDIVTAYGSDGFTLGTNLVANTNGQQYYYFAWKGGDGEVALGNYVGNAVDNRDVISGLTFQPRMVFIRRRNLTTASVAFRLESNTGDQAYQVSAFAATTNQIQAFNPDGVQVGTNGSVNANTATYDWIAFNPPVNQVIFSSYTGVGTDNYNASSGYTWQPELVFIKGNTTQLPVIRGTVHTGDSTTRINNSVANAANIIQTFNSDGFQVGTNASVNSATTTYHYLMMRNV